MTVLLENTRNQYNGNGITLEFFVTFYFLLNDDLKVILYNSVTDTETELIETTHYEVTGAGNPAGGAVMLIDAPTSDETLTILRDVYAVQETDYLEHTAFPAESHERALDRVTMLHQQVNERVDRSLKFKQSATEVDVEIKTLEAGRTLVVNATADGLKMGLPGEDVEGYAAAAAASAAAAAASETAAASSETAAAASETAAAASETAAAASAAGIGFGTPTELTISAGVVTISGTDTMRFHSIDTEADAASDDLTTINGGNVGDLIILQAANDARTVVGKVGTSLKLSYEISLNNIEDKLMLICISSGVWHELSRSSNS